MAVKRNVPGSAEANLLIASVKNVVDYHKKELHFVLHIVKTNKNYNGSLWNKRLQRV